MVAVYEDDELVKDLDDEKIIQGQEGDAWRAQAAKEKKKVKPLVWAQEASAGC